MSNVLVSLNENILRVSYYGTTGFQTTSVELSSDIAKDSEILDAQAFSTSLKDIISQVLPPKDKKPVISFLVEPENVILKFILVNKKDGDINEQLLAEVKSKLDGVSIEDLYFSYIKIAPFVYQLAGIKKDVMEKYLEVSNTVGLPLQSIVPWVSLLPRYVGSNSSAIFIVRNSKSPEETQSLATDMETGKQIIALSELNGIYFVGEYNKEKTTKELQSLIHDLSIYRRSVPINTIYTLGYQHFDLGETYQISPINLPGSEDESNKGAELHLLYNSVFVANPELLESQLNLLTLLPTPSIVKKSNALVLVGAGIAALVLVLGSVVLFGHLKNKSDSQLAANNMEESPVVLSETDSQPESSESTSSVKETLNKSDLALKIENGAGIPGIAGRLKETLATQGYKVLEVGNADTNRQNTLVKFKTSKMKYKDLLSADLKDYTLVFEDGLAEDSANDVLIVIGTK